VDDTPSLRDERVPTAEELRKILLSADSKSRVCCILLAHDGLRTQTLGNYMGTDGLRVRDFPEMRVENGSVCFDKVPTMVIVRRELSKAGHQYFTFLSEEGCEYLKNYLEEKMMEGEKISAESPIITPKLRMKPFIRTVNIGDVIGVAFNRVVNLAVQSFLGGCDVGELRLQARLDVLLREEARLRRVCNAMLRSGSYLPGYVQRTLREPGRPVSLVRDGQVPLKALNPREERVFRRIVARREQIAREIAEIEEQLLRDVKPFRLKTEPKRSRSRARDKTKPLNPGEERE